MNKNVIFIHVAILPKCKERIIQYLGYIKESGLINQVDKIFICFIGKDNISIEDEIITKYNNNNNIVFCKLSENLSDYELPTLNFLYNFSIQQSDCNILYLHTKNVGKDINLCIEDQIEYMSHFLIKKWDKCIEKLLVNDTCGVDLREEPTLHYSGNFWWTKSSYINTLPSPNEFNNLEQYPNPLNSLRHNQEFWICYNKNEKHFSLWDCGINCYERHLHRYHKELYDTV
jgi:hypothetical protein